MNYLISVHKQAFKFVHIDLAMSFPVTFEFVRLHEASHHILLVDQQLVGIFITSLICLVTILNRADLSLELASSTVISLQYWYVVV